MEISMWEIYWLFKLDDIRGLFVILSIIIGCMGGLAAIAIAVEKGTESVIKYLKIVIPVFLLTLSLATFIPGSKTLAAMYVVPSVVNNKSVQQIPQKILDLANQKLDELLTIKVPKK